jgi:hypothetical protein
MSFPACAKDLTFSVDLRTGVGDPAVPPYITYQAAPQDSNGDGWYETVLRINLNGSPYSRAQFQVHYTAEPGGTGCCGDGNYNVNIGDSSTNNGGGGDAGTQSNDAEFTVGNRGAGFVAGFGNLDVFGKDGSQVQYPNGQIIEVPNLVSNGVTATFTVANDFVAWDNHQGTSGSITSPWLFALAGQPDTEGPVNYDIYAAFNRVIAGPYRLGTGVGQVTVTLSSSVSFAGTPGKPNCHGQSVSALARQYGGLNAAAVALGLDSVQALQEEIDEYCEG